MRLYDTDLVLWSEIQAALLRRRVAGALVQEAALDRENIAAEIENVGSAQGYQLESLLLQALLHRLQTLAWRHATHVPHWQSEATVFLAGICANLRKALPRTIGRRRPLPVPPVCPWALDDLLSPSG